MGIAPPSATIFRGGSPIAPMCMAALAAAALAGCSTARVDEPITRSAGGDAPEAQMDFWHRLTEQPVTCNDDAFHGLLLFLAGGDAAGDYDGRVAALKARGLLPADFAEPAENGIRRGTLARAVARMLKIDGGLTMRVIGPTPRYAVRELQYLRIYPRSSGHQTFSGDEFVSVIGRLEDYQRSMGIDPAQETTP